jgi:hypothetical protein|tara:strand:+ start:2436 stop:2738 length:303 start_codon:yes stop_codon:yes gene_type:complete
MKKIDHLALSVDDPEEAANWYIKNFDGQLLYCDDSWSFVQFENIKIAFVKKGTHPSHFAFEVDNFEDEDIVKEHRDNTLSSYKKDPWGNVYELIKYPEKT